jgi:predicted Zn-dependent protease
MSKRLAFLEKLVADGKADSFGLYGLALEYRSLGRLDDALATFQTLRERDPDYVAMYLMAGQIFVERGDKTNAIAWLDEGLVVAGKKRDSHAAGELQSLRDSLD